MPSTTNPIEVLERWQNHGAHWRLVTIEDGRAVVDLCTCHGEPVDRLESDDPGLLKLLEGRTSSG